MRGLILRRAAHAAAMLCLFVMPVAAKDSASVEIKAQVAGVCNMPQPAVNEVSFDPLHLQAMVNTNCNTTHTLTITYSPAEPSNPETLQMTFDGQPPTTTAPGSATFGNLPMTNTAKSLVIQYAGSASDRTSVKNSLQVQVSP
jgi:hypothetical protein